MQPKDSHSPAMQSALELHYSRIANSLTELWGKPGCEPYLLSLVFDERGGRQGFPIEVADELLFLFRLIERAPDKYDLWFETDRHV